MAKLISADQFVREFHDAIEEQALVLKAKALAETGSEDEAQKAYERFWESCFGGMQAMNNRPMAM